MSELKKEDYAEPRCLLCDEPYGAEKELRPVPQQRIIQKMDEYMSRRDYAGAERHLLYWLEEARLGRDQRGQLMLCNELVGHYRKVSDRENAFRYADEALRLIDALQFDRSVSAGTTYTNIATACSAFGENERALSLFEKARAVYEASPMTRPELLGGLYNNMALAAAALGRFDEASGLYEKALGKMRLVKNGELEQAITYLNMADAEAAKQGPEDDDAQICGLLDRAETLLDTPGIPHDGYYAFVCEKCAPVFDHYGYFLTAQKLKDAADAIYRGNEAGQDSR